MPSFRTSAIFSCISGSTLFNKSSSEQSAAKLNLLAESVMAKCDEIDGLKDGLIDDPRKCDFDPARDVPACTDGMDNVDCLTTPQAAAIAKV